MDSVTAAEIARLDSLPRDAARLGAEAMKTATNYTDLPAELHRQTLYVWGRRGLRTYHGFRFKGATGRPRCTFDPAWPMQFTAIRGA